MDSPTREWADVLVDHKGERWRVRVVLEGRSEPLEYPGMMIGELFGAGEHRKRRFRSKQAPYVIDPGL
ncbi:hypothetical protein [Streptomyces sp. NPDC054866]